MKALLVAGARPNFMKIAPIVRAVPESEPIECIVIQTGQHYDHEMSSTFFQDLDIPEPSYFLEGGSWPYAVQTAGIMTAFEQVCGKERPDLFIVVGAYIFLTLHRPSNVDRAEAFSEISAALNRRRPIGNFRSDDRGRVYHSE